MGLFARVKDILFEEEEVTEPIKVVKEEKVERNNEKKVEKKYEQPKRVMDDYSFNENNYHKEEVKQPVRQPEKYKKEDDYETLGERDLFKSEKTFPFPEFDEAEFSNSVSRPTPKTTNVLEYERKKKVEKRTDYGRYEKVEIKETVEKRKFKPSPIISPVYGILNEDYKIEDIRNKDLEKTASNLDIEKVRKKAFETLEILEEEPKTTFYEETVTVKLKEPVEEKIQKVKTIDDLLDDTDEQELNLRPTRESLNENQYSEIEEELDEVDESNKLDFRKEEEDTLENDLFDLIDSMYDSREDGDY
ncbi:MAG: hypothetical protein RR325_04895 [Bacilli bacterium]